MSNIKIVSSILKEKEKSFNESYHKNVKENISSFDKRRKDNTSINKDCESNDSFNIGKNKSINNYNNVTNINNNKTSLISVKLNFSSNKNNDSSNIGSGSNKSDTIENIEKKNNVKNKTNNKTNNKKSLNVNINLIEEDISADPLVNCSKYEEIKMDIIKNISSDNQDFNLKIGANNYSDSNVDTNKFKFKNSSIKSTFSHKINDYSSNLFKIGNPFEKYVNNVNKENANNIINTNNYSNDINRNIEKNTKLSKEDLQIIHPSLSFPSTSIRNLNNNHNNKLLLKQNNFLRKDYSFESQLSKNNNKQNDNLDSEHNFKFVNIDGKISKYQLKKESFKVFENLKSNRFISVDEKNNKTDHLKLFIDRTNGDNYFELDEINTLINDNDNSINSEISEINNLNTFKANSNTNKNLIEYLFIKTESLFNSKLKKLNYNNTVKNSNIFNNNCNPTSINMSIKQNNNYNFEMTKNIMTEEIPIDDTKIYENKNNNVNFQDTNSFNYSSNFNINNNNNHNSSLQQINNLTFNKRIIEKDSKSSNFSFNRNGNETNFETQKNDVFDMKFKYNQTDSKKDVKTEGYKLNSLLTDNNLNSNFQTTSLTNENINFKQNTLSNTNTIRFPYDNYQIPLNLQRNKDLHYILEEFSNSKILSSNEINPYLDAQPERILDAPNLQENISYSLLDWSDSNILATALENLIYLWDGNNLTSRLFYSADENTTITSIKWIKNSNLISFGTNEGVVHIWDTKNNNPLRKMAIHSSIVSNIEWNANYLYSIGSDGKIIINNVKILNHIEKVLYNNQYSIFLNISISNNFLISSEMNGTISIWDLNKTIGKHEFVNGNYGSFSKSNNCIKNTDFINEFVRNVNYDLKLSFPYKIISRHKDAVRSVSFCPWDNKLFASAGLDKYLRIWDFKTAMLLKEIKFNTPLYTLNWNTYRYEILLTLGQPEYFLSIINFSNFKKVSDLICHSSPILYTTFNYDKTIFLTAGGDDKVVFWNIFGK